MAKRLSVELCVVFALALTQSAHCQNSCNLPAVVGSSSTDDILYSYTPGGPILNDGHFGQIATLQAALRAKLTAPNASTTKLLKVDGQFGPCTGAALLRLLSMPGFTELAPYNGRPIAITIRLWKRLLPNTPLPSVEQRAMTLVLTNEQTPYDGSAEWNFCQSRNVAVRRTEQPCISNDPESFLTWGPRGATAGGGREIQAILIKLLDTQPYAINAAFGNEAPNLIRLLSLPAYDRLENPETKIFLCGIWMNPSRAKMWAQGFAVLGQNPEARQIYEELYDSRDYDGGKMEAFYHLYSVLNRRPTELDYTFFLDRATHTDGVFLPNSKLPIDSPIAINSVAVQIRKQLPDEADPWRIRRAIANIMVPRIEPQDRNGRDVEFFVGGLGLENLTQSERKNWIKQGSLYAEDAGLSDRRPGPLTLDISSAKFQNVLSPAIELNSQETAACPLWVLNSD